MSNIDNSICHCNEFTKIRLKNFNFNLFCCNCIYDMNCCNLSSNLTKLVETKNCTICNKTLEEFDIHRCKLYLEIYDVIKNSNHFENNDYFITSYNNLYIRILDFSFSSSFNVAQLNFDTIHRLKFNEIIEKFIHKNIYIWFQENYKYFLNIY